MKKKGFTLIELLVVIAIIGVLATITFVGYRSVKAKAKDTQRKTDVAALTRSIETYELDHNGKYPISKTSSLRDDGTTELLGLSTTSQAGAAIISALGAVPRDKYRIDKTDEFHYYHYLTNASGTSYQIQAKLEEKANWYMTSSNSVTSSSPTTTYNSTSLGLGSIGLDPIPYFDGGSIAYHRSGTGMRVDWSQAEFEYENEPIFYNVTITLANTPTVVVGNLSRTGDTSYTLLNLTHNTRYIIAVQTENFWGDTGETISRIYHYVSSDATAPTWKAGSYLEPGVPFNCVPGSCLISVYIDGPVITDAENLGLDVDHYELEYQQNGGSWVMVMAPTTSPYITQGGVYLTVPRASTYNFRAKIVDEAGNKSAAYLTRNGIVIP